MITKSTVLILGAGASIPYGYPSGRQLLDRVRANLTKSVSHYKNSIFYKLEFSEKQTNLFCNALLKCPLPSVDAFLEHRPEFINIGKIAIALEIAKCEDEKILFHPASVKNDENWYGYLFEQLGSIDKEFRNSKLAILTYNYDRSLKHFLIEALRATYAPTPPKLKKMISSIPIVHLHGSLGELPVVESKATPYAFENLPKEDLERFAKGIKIIHENDFSNEYKRAYEILEKAEIICFLGFGYHEVNLTRLFKNSWNKSGKSFCGTAIGLTEIEKVRVIQELKQYGCSNFLMDAKEYSSLRFLRETGVLYNSKPYLKYRVGFNPKIIGAMPKPRIE